MYQPARICGRVVRIFSDRLLERIESLLQVRLGPLVPEETSFEVRIVRFRVYRASSRKGGLISRRKLEFDGLSDGLRHLVFGTEDVAQTALIR
jgi:hypothetical protein